MSVAYKEFLMINYTLHQICSSTLVSPSWLEVLLDFDQSAAWTEPSVLVIDFRRVAPSYFQLLAVVCSLVQDTFDDAFHTLAETHYVNQYLPSQARFLEEMSSLNQSITASIQEEFRIMQNWLDLMTTHSQLLIGLTLNGGLASIDDSDIFGINDVVLGIFGEVTETSVTFISTCSCRQDPAVCHVLTFLVGINATQSYPRRILVDMNAGCVPWLGLRLTDTTWWYRTDVIEQIRILLDNSPRNQSDPIISPLSNQTQTRFPYQSGSYPLFEAMLDEALLERWAGDLTRFDLFYHECAPIECTYLIESKRSLLAALLLLLSVCGGLNQVLRWFVLLFVKLFVLIRSRHRHRHLRGQWNLVRNIRRSLLELNLFRSRSTDARQIRRERTQTRLYLCLLSASLVILILYTSLEERAVVETMDAPSNSTEYEHFRQIYPSTLECTCSRSALPYNSIIPKLEVESFHPICNSSFISRAWFGLLQPSMYLPANKMNQDYDQWITPLFRLLATLCSTARDQVDQNVVTFLSSSTVVNRLISAEQFEGQVSTTITQLQQQIPAQFAQMVDSIRLSQQGNALVSVFSSNWRYLVRNGNRSEGAALGRQSVSYENGTCSCALSQRCSMPASLYNAQGTAIYDLIGLRLGCTIFEALLQSSFECFYSATCIDSLVYALGPMRDLNPSSYEHASTFFIPLSENSSIFADNDTMETIVNRMFINHWRHELSYEALFQGCAARECTYTRHYRFDALEVVTTFLSFFGGLSICLRFLVPHFITAFDRIRQRC